MRNEIEYTGQIGSDHIKEYGQYFTNYSVADFMCKWACCKANTMLDPAVGNGVFFRFTKKYSPNCSLTGYEIDQTILNFFSDDLASEVINRDYLSNNWNQKYDAIVCNPPYNRFQAVSNRSEIINELKKHTGVNLSGYTNLYILFLIKSIYQMSSTGRLAYIIPTEFLNSKYGTEIKKILINEKLLRAIINFENNSEMFFNATTTSCILLLDKSEKDHVDFFNISSLDELSKVEIGNNSLSSIRKKYKDLDPSKKWREYLNQEEIKSYKNIVPVSNYCYVTRGIATGANDYFCLSSLEMQKNHIPESCVSKCICRSADINAPVFTEDLFYQLTNDNKKTFLLDIDESKANLIFDYINIGIHQEIHHKYLPSCRNPWYSMEQKEIAPIWVSSACRKNIKFIRNLSSAKNLTTFHSVFIREKYIEFTDIIFCYFLSKCAQDILRENRKELGNGLGKFQPNDLNEAMMLDISEISKEDIMQIYSIYDDIKSGIVDKSISRLNEIFESYLQ